MIAFTELLRACRKVGMGWRESIAVSSVCTYRQYAKDRFLPYVSANQSIIIL